MVAFAERFGEDSAEIEVLRLLGLFDRPATKGAIDAVRTAPAMPELTAHLSGLDEAGWLRLVERLRATGLVAPKSSHAPDEVDAHPLVREHFGAELRANHPEAWRAGHARLYEYFKALPEKEQPDTLEEMAPLFQAVFHGCQAGLHQEALVEVYYARLQRDGGTNYWMAILGAVGSDLAALAGFFDPPWERPVRSINEEGRGAVLNWAGFRLRALGRLTEAVQPLRASLNMAIAREDWSNATQAALTLSQLHLRLGEVAEAVALMEQHTDYADRTADASRIFVHAALADAVHQAGERVRAEALFQEAERLQEERQPEYPQLYSLQGYLYCDLLLQLGRHAEVRDRGKYALDVVLRGSRTLLAIALNLLSLGRAEVVAHEMNQSGDLAKAEEHLNQAVDGLRKAGQIDELPRGLLGRAAYLRLTEQFDRARRELDEAMRIATRSGMRLHECDAHLEYARLELAQGNHEAARTCVGHAERLVAATGYHRRDRDLEELRAALG